MCVCLVEGVDCQLASSCGRSCYIMHYSTLTHDAFLFITLYCIYFSGDHLEEVAEMIVTKFGVSGEAVFLDLDGEFVSYA